VAEQVAELVKRNTPLELVRGIAVPQDMHRDALRDASATNGGFKDFGQTIFMAMVPPNNPTTGISRKIATRENPEPRPLTAGIGVFVGKGARESHRRQALGLIALPQSACALNVLSEARDETRRDGERAVFIALGTTDGDEGALEIDVFNAKANDLHEAEPATVNHVEHE